jgi:hypothetical protein
MFCYKRVTERRAVEKEAVKKRWELGERVLGVKIGQAILDANAQVPR